MFGLTKLHSIMFALNSVSFALYSPENLRWLLLESTSHTFVSKINTNRDFLYNLEHLSYFH